MEFKKLLSFLGIPYQVYTTRSSYNGEIIVSSVFGQNSISVENLTQTGPIVEIIWKKALKKVHKKEIQNILVLGVGGGSILKVIRSTYKDANIVGIEIDKKMIDIGKKYFKLNSFNTVINIKDAFEFVKKDRDKYDLILIDLLIGRNHPEKLSSEEFFKNINRRLSKSGTVVINQLRLKEQKTNNGLIKILQSIFTRVEIYNPLVNTLILCIK